MIPGERASDRSLQLFVPEAGPAKTKKRLWYLLKLWQWLPHIQLNYFKSQLFSFSFEEWVDIKTNRLIRYMLALPQKQQSDFPTQHQVRIWNLKDSKGSPVVIPFPTSRGLGFLTNCPPTRPRGGGFCEGLHPGGNRIGTIRFPPSILQAPKLRAKTPQTLKQLENNLKQMCAGVYKSKVGLA